MSNPLSDPRMMGAKALQRPSYDRRRYRRYDLAYPVHLSYRRGDTLAHFTGVSKNIGMGGMLVEAPSLIAASDAVSFVITLQGGSLLHPVELSGEGKVVRIERGKRRPGYSIAIEGKRPITRIEEHHPSKTYCD